MYIMKLVSNMIECLGLLRFTHCFPSVHSWQEPPDLQHRDEEQDEGTSDGGRDHLLEVDQLEHHRPCHRDLRLPLVNGRSVKSISKFHLSAK